MTIIVFHNSQRLVFEIKFVINGPDEERVADELEKLFANRFYEDS